MLVSYQAPLKKKKSTRLFLCIEKEPNFSLFQASEDSEVTTLCEYTVRSKLQPEQLPARCSTEVTITFACTVGTTKGQC